MSLSDILNHEPESDSKIVTTKVKQEPDVVPPQTLSPQEEASLREAQEAAGALAALASGGSSRSVYRHNALPFVSPSIKTDLQSSRSLTSGHSLQHPDVKNEPIRPSPPQLSNQEESKDVDVETAKAIAAAQNEYNTRVRIPKKQPENMVPTAEVDMSEPTLQGPISPTNGASMAPKKRPPPKTSSAPKAPSSANKKPPSKKRKVEVPEESSPPTSSHQSPAPSAPSKSNFKAPSSSKAKKPSLPLTPKALSPALAPSPSGVSEASDDQVYCVCRRPDDHTWMIGCDGGCDDWFHGKCVHISQSDENLIDKFICPNCAAKDAGVTTWKPMCRREGCRKPARLRKGEESKYCSNACGVAFFNATLKRVAGTPDTHPSSKNHKQSKEGLPIDQIPPALDSGVGPLGGCIRTHELKALAYSTSSADDFRRLGSAPLITPPQSASPDISRPAQEDFEDALEPSYNEQETQRLSEIENLKKTLKHRRQLLKERHQFVTLMKAQREATAERLKIKDVCGFDSRWSMDDVSFKSWRESGESDTSSEKETLDAPADADANEDTNMVNGTSPTTPSAKDVTHYICTKRRCERHRQWQKLVLQDVRFEEADLGNEMRRIDAEEKDIKQRAVQRTKALEKGNLNAKQSADGWVEVVPEQENTESVANELRALSTDARDVVMGEL